MAVITITLADAANGFDMRVDDPSIFTGQAASLVRDIAADVVELVSTKYRGQSIADAERADLEAGLAKEAKERNPCGSSTP